MRSMLGKYLDKKRGRGGGEDEHMFGSKRGQGLEWGNLLLIMVAPPHGERPYSREQGRSERYAGQRRNREQRRNPSSLRGLLVVATTRPQSRMGRTRLKGGATPLRKPTSEHPIGGTRRRGASWHGNNWREAWNLEFPLFGVMEEHWILIRRTRRTGVFAFSSSP